MAIWTRVASSVPAAPRLAMTVTAMPGFGLPGWGSHRHRSPWPRAFTDINASCIMPSEVSVQRKPSTIDSFHHFQHPEKVGVATRKQ